VDEKSSLVTYDAEEFRKALNEIVKIFATELKRRYLETAEENIT
jgi:hypothetical protein